MNLLNITAILIHNVHNKIVKNTLITSNRLANQNSF